MDIFTQRKREKKGQSAIEYIFIVALALLIVIPGTIIFYQYSQSSQKAIVSSQIYKIGTDMVSSAHTMYSLGDNSWQTIELNLPSTVHEIKIYNESSSTSSRGVLVIRHGTDYLSDAVFFSRIPLLNTTSDDCSEGCTLAVTQGFTRFRVESGDGLVRFRVL